MDPQAFYDIILPAAGLRCMAIPYPKGGFFHSFGESNEWLAEATQHVDTKRQVNVYFACASFRTTVSRRGDNVQAVRSFWADIDCGPGKPYEKASQGAAAALAFAKTVGLPRPYLVSSGRGVHAYWPMDADMDPATWLVTAQLLKAAALAEGLSADPSRTADYASVLRPPGTHHRKAEPRLVKVAVEGRVGTLADFQACLLPYAHLVPTATSATADMFLPEGGPAEGFAFANDDLTGGVEQRTSLSARIAERCGIIKLLRDTRGDVDQPTWYHSMPIMAATTDGADLIHPWSSGYAGYSAAETDRKWAQASKQKPTSCGKLSESHPELCALCPHQGKIKTPWTLGIDDGTVQVETTTTAEVSPGVWSTVPVNVSAPLGYEFAVVGGVRCITHNTLGTNDAGEEVWVKDPISETVFYAISRIRIDGVAHLELEMELPKDEKRRFTMDAAIIGRGKDSLASELARQEIVILPNKGMQMHSYMGRWLTQMKMTAPLMEAHQQFGWTDNMDFVLGESLLQAGGGQSRAILKGMAKSRGPALVPKGSLETWTRVIDTAYNAPGQEGYQFLVTCGFAAPLLTLMDQVNGVTVYAHSEGSGAGKTTAQRAGLSAWGDWDVLQLAEGKVTTNMLWGLMGAYNTLPIVYDELTNQKNDIASELVFSVSSGRAKERMRSDGEARENNSNWNTILMASGNTLLSEKLAQHRGNAEAEISRLFEFTLTATNHLTPNEANGLFPLLKQNYGHAGQVFARYVVDNRERVTSRLHQIQAALNEDFKITQVERYWSSLLACNIVALSICRKLNLLGFDQAALLGWMTDRLQENRGQRNAAATNPLELLGSMLSELQSGILVTTGEGDLRKAGAAAMVVEKPRGNLVGRAILPPAGQAGANVVTVLMLNDQAVRDWSNKKGVSAREVFAAAVRAGWCEPDMVKYSLGRGTVEYAATSSHIRCWKLYPDKIAGASTGRGVAQKLTALAGGLDGPDALQR